MKHHELVEAANEAVNAVHGDSSVSQEETIESLDEIIGNAEMLRSAVEQDIQRAKPEGLLGEDDDVEERES